VITGVSGYLIAGTSWLHRRHPLTKLLGVLFVVVTAILLPAIALPWLAVALTAGAISAGLGRPLLRSLRIPAVLFASILAVNALFFPGGRDVLLQLGPLAVTREGLAFGVLSAGRLLVVFMASALVLFTTLPDDLLEALVARGVSHRIAFVVLSAVQLVPQMQERARRILTAQQARGLTVDGSIARRTRALITLVAPVILGALIDVRERTFALEARGFGARRDRTAYRVVPDSGLDRILRIGLMVAMVAIVAAVVTGAVR
jgi:energy-coupling factor transport system permease protein